MLTILLLVFLVAGVALLVDAKLQIRARDLHGAAKSLGWASALFALLSTAVSLLLLHEYLFLIPAFFFALISVFAFVVLPRIIKSSQK
jgi:hypothetical protein